MTSQAGLYTCRTFLTIPGHVVDHRVEYIQLHSDCKMWVISWYCVFQWLIIFIITVPASEVVAIYESRGAPICEGTVFSLSCLITPNMTGVNTNITIQQNFTRPGMSAADRVTREDTAFQTILMFRPVTMADDGRYVCSAVAISISQYSNVEASNATVNNTRITISSKLMSYKFLLSSSDMHTHTHTHTHTNFPCSSATPSDDHHSSTYTHRWSELHSWLLCQDRKLCHQCS